MKEFKIAFVNFIIIILVGSQQVFDLGQYTSSQLYENWGEIKERLSLAQVLKISFSGLSQIQLIRVLSQSMPNLRQLSFTKYYLDKSSPIYDLKNDARRQYVTPKMLEVIFTSGYFERLREIDLIGANIDDRYFEFMEEEQFGVRQFKLQSMKLGSNYIGRLGFSRLSKLKLPNLKVLDVSGNLLMEEEAIQSLVALICGFEPKEREFCSKSLQFLDISSTNIDVGGFVKLLRCVNVSNLKFLNISIYKDIQKKYQEQHNLTAYQFLAQREFTSLIQLQMNDLGLDSSVVPVFKNWGFPQLQSLMLFSNFIDDECVKAWITRDNFPRLKRLILYNNYLGDESLIHLRDQRFDLLDLNIGFNHMTYKGIGQIAEFASSNLQKIYLKQSKIQSKDLRLFFEKMKLQGVKELGFSSNSEIGDVFTYFPWKKFQKLQKLIMTDCFIQVSIDQIIRSPLVLGPTLKLLLFNNTGVNHKNTLEFLRNVKRVFPQLQLIDLVQNYMQPLNFSEVVDLDLSDRLEIDLGYIRFYKKDGKLRITSLGSLGVVALCSLRLELSEYFQYPQQMGIKIQKEIDRTKVLSDELLTIISAELCQIFDFSELWVLKLTKPHEVKLLIYLIQHCGDEYFVDLEVLTVEIETPITDAIKLLEIIPSQSVRRIKMQIVMDESEEQTQLFFKKLRYYVAITRLVLQFRSKGQGKKNYNFNKYLNRMNFPFLQIVWLGESDMIPEELSGFIHNHAYSLRSINLNNNYLQTKFISILVKNELILTQIDLSFISFSIEEFILLSGLDLSHLRILRLKGCDLTTNHLINFVYNYQNGTTIFPKLKTLMLDDNDIREEGTLRLFETGLSQLNYLKLNRNYNPNYLNIILSFNTKLQEISALGADVYAISKALSVKSTRRVYVLTIATNDFQFGDFEVMGTLDYRKLIVSQLMLSEVYECQIFMNLLKINQYASKIIVAIDNDKKGLDSSCLKNNKEFSNYNSQAEEVLFNDKHYTTFSQYFLELMLRSERNLKVLMIYQAKALASTFLSISGSRIKNLQILNIPRNYMNDEAFQRFIETPLQNLKFLDVSENEITIKSFRRLRQRSLPRVEEINFSSLDLGDESLSILSTMKMPQLKRLFMMSCQLVNISKFNDVHLPSLFALGLQRNGYSFGEVMFFLQNLNRVNLPQLQNLSLRGLEVSVSEFDSIINLGKSKNVTIELDEAYHIILKNNANY